MRNRTDPEIHTEPTIELLFCGVAGNGMRVYHPNMIEPNDTMKMAIGKEAILQRTFNIKKIQSIATIHYQ